MNPTGSYFFNGASFGNHTFNFTADFGDYTEPTPTPGSGMAVDAGIAFRNKKDTFRLSQKDHTAALGDPEMYALMMHIQNLPEVSIFKQTGPESFVIEVDNPVPCLTTMEGPNYEPSPQRAGGVAVVPRQVAGAYAQPPEPAQAGFSGWL